MFCLLVPSHCSWRASTEIADITFVCQTVVHCLHMDFEIPLSGSSVIAQMALIFHPLVFLLILMPFQFLQNFTFVVTLVTCVLDTIMFFLVVLFCLILIFRSEVTHVTLNDIVAMNILDVRFQPSKAAEVSGAICAGK